MNENEFEQIRKRMILIGDNRYQTLEGCEKATKKYEEKLAEIADDHADIAVSIGKIETMMKVIVGISGFMASGLSAVILKLIF